MVPFFIAKRYKNSHIYSMRIVLLPFLIIASIFDWKTRTIPFWVAIPPFLFQSVILIIRGQYWNFAYGAGFFLFFLIWAYFRVIGGADCIYGGLVGLYFGMSAFYVLVISCVMSIPHGIYAKTRKTDYPLLPYLFFGALIITIKEAIWF